MVDCVCVCVGGEGGRAGERNKFSLLLTLSKTCKYEYFVLTSPWSRSIYLVMK